MEKLISAPGSTMNLSGLPHNGTKPFASPTPAVTNIPSLDNTSANSVAPESSSPDLTNPEIQTEKRNGLASGPADSSLASSGTQKNTEVPAIRVQQDHSERSSPLKEGDTSWLSRKTSKRSPIRPRIENAFEGITLDIPSGGLSDELSADEMKFSKRGSMLIDGQKANGPLPSRVLNNENPIAGRAKRPSPSLRARAATKMLSTDEETLSQKVRSFYEVGSELPPDADGNSSLGRRMGLRWQDALAGHDGKSTSSISRATSNSDLHSVSSSLGQRLGSTQEPITEREENELAGGMEDWQDVDHGDIDRYGFILPRSQTSEQPSSQAMARSVSSREPPTLHRVSTTLQLASEAPRRKHTIKRSPSSAHGTSGMSAGPGVNGQASGQSAIRPASSQSAYHGSLAKRTSSLPKCPPTGCLTTKAGG